MGLQTFSYPVDMWSVGCVLFELAHGQPLFKNHGGLSQIENICRIKNEIIPNQMIAQVNDEKRKFFYLSVNERLQMDLEQNKHVKSFEQFLETEVFHEQIELDQKYILLIDLLGRMLSICPYKRIKPDEALTH